MIISENIKKQSAEQIITSAIDYCKKQGFSIAIWRHPDHPGIQMMVDFSTDLPPALSPLESGITGFVFAPFDPSNHTYMIRADLHMELEDYKINCAKGLEISIKTDQLLSYLSETQPSEEETAQSIETASSGEEGKNFKKLVKLSIQAIESGIFQKIVPSRMKNIRLSEGFKIGKNFINLASTYGAAFTSLVYSPKTGIWIGASPELLISEKDNIFKTVALAGTQPYDDTLPVSQVAWRQKEIEEQALVCRYIINCFKKIRLRDYVESGPRTMRAGNLLHLKTDYMVDMEATGFPDLGETMLQLLHPTSAICGMPLKPSLEFLKHHEHYERAYFSGYLGPVNFENTKSLFVNLRCMHIEGSIATLFAGAGVTEDSIPDKEWEETEIKMNTLLNVLTR